MATSNQAPLRPGCRVKFQSTSNNWRIGTLVTLGGGMNGMHGVRFPDEKSETYIDGKFLHRFDGPEWATNIRDGVNTREFFANMFGMSALPGNRFRVHTDRGSWNTSSSYRTAADTMNRLRWDGKATRAYITLGPRGTILNIWVP